MRTMLNGKNGTVVIIESRDLDTDARSMTSIEVEVPHGEVAQRAQLAELVARVHPVAHMRSFGEGAASFLDSTQLVVAHYESCENTEERERHSATEPAEQRSLFAA